MFKKIESNNIGTFEYISDLENSILEDVEITILGVVSNYLIIEENKYIGEKFRKQNYNLTYNLMSQFY